MPFLSELSPGSQARVTAIDERLIASDPELAKRLMEMGLLPGTPLKVVRLAPLGDPIDIEVRGYHLSLRRADAEMIQIEDL